MNWKGFRGAVQNLRCYDAMEEEELATRSSCQLACAHLRSLRELRWATLRVITSEGGRDAGIRTRDLLHPKQAR